MEKEILRVAVGEITTAEARGGPFTDEDATKILRKLVKSNEEAIAAGADEAQTGVLREEIEVITSFLPKTLGADEVLAALAPVRAEIVAAAGDGPATGIAMKHLKSSGAEVDGKTVSETVRKLRSP
ncbi:MAG TPA: GatB/YqeY domain-containing protein [Polyangiaceae bacterium]